MASRSLRTRLVENRLGDEIRQFDIDAAALTGPEVDYLIGFRDADELRGAVVKARSQRDERLRAKAVRPSEADQGSLSKQADAQAPPTQPIENFGEKIAGAYVLAHIAAMRDMIPNMPRYGRARPTCWRTDSSFRRSGA